MTYIPLIYLTVTAVGGCMALSNITPVAPPARYITIGRASGNDGRPFGRYPVVLTPPGDPTPWAHVRCQPYRPPATRPTGHRLYPPARTTWAMPPRPKAVA